MDSPTYIQSSKARSLSEKPHVWPLLKPHASTLVLMAGPPGAGKTTLAHTLGEVLQWPILDRDSFYSRLQMAEISEERANRISYMHLLDLGCDLLRQRFSVILDSPAGHAYVVEQATRLAEEEGAHLKIIYCYADADLRNRRLAEREPRPFQSM
jgi:predicted kinase